MAGPEEDELERNLSEIAEGSELPRDKPDWSPDPGSFSEMLEQAYKAQNPQALTPFQEMMEQAYREREDQLRLEAGREGRLQEIRNPLLEAQPFARMEHKRGPAARRALDEEQREQMRAAKQNDRAAQRYATQTARQREREYRDQEKKKD